MKFFIQIILILSVVSYSCNNRPKTEISPWIDYDEKEEIVANSDHSSLRMRYKLIQSKILDRNIILSVIESQLDYFNEEDYLNYKELILNQDITSIQGYVQSGKLSYEVLTKWYLYRIAKYESDKNTSLHNIISINPEAVTIAKERDKKKGGKDHLIYGIPVLLKDNINFISLPTTAGAEVLLNNYTTSDAFITTKIKEKGGII